MPKPKRLLNATAELTTTPPDALPNENAIAKVVSTEGKNLYTVELPSKQNLLVELAPQFRNNFWIKRGGFVVVDTAALADRNNKLQGEIVNVVRDEKQWRKMPWWPKEFPKLQLLDDDDSQAESNVGRMPPSDSEEEN